MSTRFWMAFKLGNIPAKLPKRHDPHKSWTESTSESSISRMSGFFGSKKVQHPSSEGFLAFLNKSANPTGKGDTFAGVVRLKVDGASSASFAGKDAADSLDDTSSEVSELLGIPESEVAFLPLSLFRAIFHEGTITKKLGGKDNIHNPKKHTNSTKNSLQWNWKQHNEHTIQN